MKAAIYHGPGDLRIQKVKQPEPGPEGVVVRVRACGVCNVIDARTWKWWPDIGQGVGYGLGHEFAGEVVEVGSKVTGVEVGDGIFGNPIFFPCRKCEACLHGDYWRCINWIRNLNFQGFAEYLLIPFVTSQSHVKCPKELSYRDFALTEPLGLAVGLASKAKPGDVVVVLGQDLMGLAVTAELKKIGVSKVITSDISQKRLKASREVGADITVDVINDDVVKVVMQETRGEGADVVLVVDNRPAAAVQAVNVAKWKGEVWVGGSYNVPFVLRESVIPNLPQVNRANGYSIGPDAGYREPPIIFDPGLLSFQTAWMTRGSRVPVWLEALELMKEGKITADKYVTHVFPLNKIKEAFEVAMDPHESIKVIIEP